MSVKLVAWQWLAGMCGVVAATHVVSGWLRTQIRRVHVLRRSRRALAGEYAAQGLLQNHGYTLVQSQATHRWHLELDGQPVPIDLRADYIVRRGARTLVAEVKTGAVAPNITHAPTRRQLLEYMLAFDVDGVLLVNVEDGAVQEVCLPQGRTALSQPPHGRFGRWELAAGILVGAAVASLYWLGIH